MKKFYKWFKEQLKHADSSSLLKGMNYSVFGLGDTSYEQFNAIGKQVDKEFADKLGA
jgi:sulfite reductase alpha subunit-like flavoprotein